MLIATLPLKIAWADRDENLAAVENALQSLRPSTDLLVLPELFSTGYIDDNAVLSTLSENVMGDTMARMRELSAAYGVAICGSYLCRAGEKIFNRAFFIEPDGETTFYDKHHLFSLSSENRIFTAGNSEPPVIRYRGFNISMIVCYDLRFPVWCRNLRQRYDIMLVPANWPQARAFAWKTLLPARAIENQAYYVGANRGASDDFGDYDGLTFVYDPLGKDISEIDPKTGVVYATVDATYLANTRRKLPFGNDADEYVLKCQ